MSPTSRRAGARGSTWARLEHDQHVVIIGPWAGAAALDRFGPSLMWSGVFFCGLIAIGVVALSKEPAAHSVDAANSGGIVGVTSANRWTLVATILGSSMTFIDATVVNVALPALQADLHATITDVQWVIEAYALVPGRADSRRRIDGRSVRPQARLPARRRRSSRRPRSLCGFATSLAHPDHRPRAAGHRRRVSGAGKPRDHQRDVRRRPSVARAIGTWSGFSAITTAIGPVSGGWLIEHVSWRAVFFMNVPLAIVVVVLSLRFMDESRDPSRTRRIDWTGAALAVLGLGGIVFGLLEWPPLGAGHPLVLGALAIGVALARVCSSSWSAAPRTRCCRCTLFRSRTFTFANLLTLLLYAALSVIFFLVPLNLIQVQHYSATRRERRCCHFR